MFDQMHQHAVQELHYCQKGPLNAVIALHNLRLGPALGGCRFIEYSDDTQAVTDAMRLAKGMSYKAALAHVPQGGGKAVIMKPKGQFDRKELFKLFGQFIESLGGRYITAMDSGTQVTDMDVIRTQTTHVGSSSDIGDPSPSTARGVMLGLREAVDFHFGDVNKSLKNVTVAIQGLGHVGFALAKHLNEAGAKLIVCDVDEQKVKQAEQHFNAKAVSTDEIYSQSCDVFSPCGLGGVLNENTLSKLDCSIIAGCANNQLSEESIGQQLHDSGRLYAPDYVINSGGLIFASSRFRGLTPQQIQHEVYKLKNTLNKIFILSKQKNQPCHEIANEMAEHILYGPEFNALSFKEAI